MNKEAKEILVEKLLLFILDDLENEGLSYNCSHYGFFPTRNEQFITLNGLVSEKIEKEHSFSRFQKENNIIDEDMIAILNYCTSHQLLEQRTIGRKYSDLTMTRVGYARAMSVEKAKTYQPLSPTTQNISIGSMHAHNMQVGNHNTQNVVDFKTLILKEIDKSDSTPEKKEEARAVLDSFLSNPIISGIISNLPTAVVAGLLLGG